MKKTKVELKEGTTYYNKWTDTKFTVSKIYDRQVIGAAPRTLEKRVEYVTEDGKECESSYEGIREMVQKVLDDKIDYESTLFSVFNSKEFVDNDTLMKLAQEGEIRVAIHPRDRDKLADDYFQMTHEEVDSNFVDECAAEAENSNWAPSYSIKIKLDDEMWFHPDLNTHIEGKMILVKNNEMLKLLFEMGFRLGKKHNIKQLTKCMKG